MLPELEEARPPRCPPLNAPVRLRKWDAAAAETGEGKEEEEALIVWSAHWMCKLATSLVC